MPNPTDERRHHRQIVAENAALVEFLDELHPADRLPPLNATDREIGAWHGKRELIANLKLLLKEHREGTPGSLPPVIRSR